MKARYDVGYEFTFGFIPHRIVENLDENYYLVSFGYPFPNEDRLKIMSEYVIIFGED